MPDMLVNLLTLPSEEGLLQTLLADGIHIRRAMTPDKHRIVPRIAKLMGQSAASECEACFARTPVSLFIATKGATVIGFAAYNATALDYFGRQVLITHTVGRESGRLC